MQAGTVEAPFTNPEYFFEVKWDGLRCLLFVGPDGEVRLQDRALNDITFNFPEFGTIGGQVPPGTVLDGALVVTDSEGRPDVVALRHRLAGPAGEGQRTAAFLAFDLLYLEGRPMLRRPLHQRKKQLHRSIAAGRHLYAPKHIDKEGVELYEACLEQGLEGMMAKHRDSLYIPGQRSPFWLQVKAVKADNFVVVGWTGREPFDALVVAFYEAGTLLPCGSVGGGFDPGIRAELVRRLGELRTEESPLDPPPVMISPVSWVTPEIVISVRYSEWSPDGTLRFPIFDKVRPEIHPAECVRLRPRVVLNGRTPHDSPSFYLTRFPF
ncbi:MAG: non-homologous end-joining DNA ligase [Candidatus Dormibacteraceae bacterium]